MIERITAAIARAGVPQPMAGHVLAEVMAELTIVSGEWELQSSDFYYEHRHKGPIDYADGFESGWDHAAALLRGEDAEPRGREW